MLQFALTETVHLRYLETADADELYALVDANREHLLPWMPWAADQDLERTKAFIAQTRKQLAENNGFQVAMVEDGRIIGALGFGAVDWDNRSSEIGYWIAREHEGRGLVTRGGARARRPRASASGSCTGSRSRPRPRTPAARPSRSGSGSPARACCASASARATAGSTA